MISKNEAEVIQRERWKKHDLIERGNPVRTYNGMDFRRVR